MTKNKRCSLFNMVLRLNRIKELVGIEEGASPPSPKKRGDMVCPPIIVLSVNNFHFAQTLSSKFLSRKREGQKVHKSTKQNEREKTEIFFTEVIGCNFDVTTLKKCNFHFVKVFSCSLNTFVGNCWRNISLKTAMMNRRADFKSIISRF